MAGTLASLVVKIGADTRGFHSGLKGMENSAHNLGGALGKLGAVAGAGALIGVALLTAAVAEGTRALIAEEKEIAQTGAVLTSTGGAAHVSAAHITEFTDALAYQTSIDKKVIRSGENMLLTFTSIQNRVGKGNDIFDQATKTLLDMSVALGEDPKNAAIQLGKALNDPIRGVTALRRVGVQFTDQQVKTIKSLVASGHLMEAQKLILRELNTEFGGSAAALGETTAGKLAKARMAWSDLTKMLAEGLIPVIADVLSGFVTFFRSPEVQAGFKTLGDGIGKAIDFIKPILGDLVKGLGNVVSWVGTVVGKVGDWFAANRPLVTQVSDFVKGAFGTFVGWIQQIPDLIGTIATNVGNWYTSNKDLVDGLVSLTTTVIINGVSTLIDLWNNSGGVVPAIAGITAAVWLLYAGLTALAAHPVILALLILIGVLGAVKTAFDKAKEAKDKFDANNIGAKIVTVGGAPMAVPSGQILSEQDLYGPKVNTSTNTSFSRGYASGAWDLPRDMIARVHKNEMIVPANIASIFRRMVESPGASASYPGSGASRGGAPLQVSFAFHSAVPYTPGQSEELVRAVGPGLVTYLRDRGFSIESA